jgi:hypothetical protein
MNTEERESRTLLIDDERTLDVTHIARTFDEGIDALTYQHWDILYLDHDLGDPDPKKTGYDILCWLEDPKYKWKRPARIILVTMNPVGHKKMQTLINKFQQERMR